jgi:glycosyltransferase involved in cell wall biosynthesis
MRPTLSIVVLSYNQERTIRETLDSAVAVRERPLELVVCDDASSDRTREAILEWKGKADLEGIDLKLVFHAENGGTRKNLLSGCREAGGRYVKVLGGDDLLAPDGLGRMLDEMKKADIRVAFGRPTYEVEDPLFAHDEESAALQSLRFARFSDMPARRQWIKLLQCNRAFAPTALYERELLEEHLQRIERYRILEDWPLWLSISKAGIPIRYYDIPVVAYRVHAGGVSRTKEASPSRREYQRDLLLVMAESEKEMPFRLLSERVQMHLDHIRLKKENDLIERDDLRLRVMLLKAARKLLTLGRELEI